MCVYVGMGSAQTGCCLNFPVIPTASCAFVCICTACVYMYMYMCVFSIMLLPGVCLILSLHWAGCWSCRCTARPYGHLYQEIPASTTPLQQLLHIFSICLFLPSSLLFPRIPQSHTSLPPSTPPPNSNLFVKG